MFVKTLKKHVRVWRSWAETLIIAILVVFFIRTFIGSIYYVPTGSGEPMILVGDRVVGNNAIYFFRSIRRGDLVIFDDPLFAFNTENTCKAWWQKHVGISLPLMTGLQGPDSWVKRVIACPGDTIEGRSEDGKAVIYLNGKKLDEPNLNLYPLIKIQKTVGFFDNLLVSIPSVLCRDTKNSLLYSYDPAYALSDQPFYEMDKDAVVHNGTTNQPSLIYSGTVDPYDIFSQITVPQGKFFVMGDSRENSNDSRLWGFLDEQRIRGKASFILYSVDTEEPWVLFEFIKHPKKFLLRHVRWNRLFKALS